MLRQIRHMALMEPMIMSLLAGSTGQVKVELNLGTRTAKSYVCVSVGR